MDQISALVAQRLELAVTVALHGEHRVRDHVHAQARALDRHGQGIDQEGHVVGDDLHRGAQAAPPRVLVVGIEHPHFRDAGLALAQEPVQVHQQRRPFARLVLVAVGRRHAGEQAVHEGVVHAGEQSTGLGGQAVEMFTDLTLEVVNVVLGVIHGGLCFAKRVGGSGRTRGVPASRDEPGRRGNVGAGMDAMAGMDAWAPTGHRSHAREAGSAPVVCVSRWRGGMIDIGYPRRA